MHWMRYGFFGRNDRLNSRYPLLASSTENIFTFLASILLTASMVESNELTLVSWLMERCNLIEILVQILRTPPYRDHNVLFNLLFQFFILCVSVPCEVSNVIWQSLHREYMVAMCQCFMEGFTQNAASVLYALMVSREMIDFSTSKFHVSSEKLAAMAQDEGSEELKNLLLHKNRLPGLWRLSVCHSASVYDVGTQYCGYCVLEVDPDTLALSGRGEIHGIGSISVSGQLPSTGSFEEFVINRVSGTFGGTELVFAGQLSPLSSLLGGRFASRVFGGDPESSPLMMKGSWIMWKDSRPVSAELEAEAKTWIGEFAVPPATALLGFGSLPARSQEFSINIEQFYGWELLFSRNAAQMAWWSCCSKSMVKRFERELKTVYEDVFEMVQKDWAKANHVMRGPYETEANFQQRCLILNATLQFVQMLRQHVSKGFVQELEFTIGLLKSVRPEEAIGISAAVLEERMGNASTAGAIWLFRFNYCPGLLLCDEVLGLEDLLQLFINHMEGIDVERRRNGELVGEEAQTAIAAAAAAAAAASSNATGKKNKSRKKKAGQSSILPTSTTAIILATGTLALAVSAVAFLARRWFSHRRSAHHTE